MRDLKVDNRAEIDVRGLNIAKLMPDVEAAKDAIGRVGGDITLAGSGNSIARMLGTADGERRHLRRTLLRQPLADRTVLVHVISVRRDGDLLRLAIRQRLADRDNQTPRPVWTVGNHDGQTVAKRPEGKADELR